MRQAVDFFGIRVELDQREQLAPNNEILDIAEAMRPRGCDRALVRIGGTGDGAYLLPDDLDGVVACLSPGVDNTKPFEDELAAKCDISCFLCDKSSDIERLRTPLIEGKQFFTKKWLEPADSQDAISLDTLMQYGEKTLGESGDYLLQMDIEGAEYRNIIATPDSVLSRFRILIIEVHGLAMLNNKAILNAVFKPFFEKISRHFTCIHAHPNNCCGEFTLGTTDISLPNVHELTFLRNDRFPPSSASSLPQPILPNPLDISGNVPSNPPLFLHPYWISEPNHPEAIAKRHQDENMYLTDTSLRLASELALRERGDIHVQELLNTLGNRLRELLLDKSEGQFINDNRDLFDAAKGKRFRLSSALEGYATTGLIKEKNPFMFHTGFGIGESITIDLEGKHTIKEITITNRLDSCQERASNLFCIVHDSGDPPLSQALPLYIENSFLFDNPLASTTAIPGCTGRFVTILSPRFTALHLADIKVMAYK